MRIELVARLNGKRQNFGQWFGGQNLTESDIAGSLALIHHPVAPLMFRVFIAGQYQYAEALYNQSLIDMQKVAKHDKKHAKLAKYLPKLTDLGLMEVIKPRHCGECNGRGGIGAGINRIICPKCQGGGIKPYSDYSRSKYVNVNWYEWNKMASIYNDLVLPRVSGYLDYLPKW